jgi:hypothetical protein
MWDDLKIANPTREQRITALNDGISGIYGYHADWCGQGSDDTCLESAAVFRAMLEELGAPYVEPGPARRQPLT